MMLNFILIIALAFLISAMIIYYVSVAGDFYTSSKQKRSKKAFLKSLIPFYMWVMQFTKFWRTLK